MTITQKRFIYFYSALLLTCVFLMISSNFLDPVTRQAILPVATDGFKTVLGAIIGTLSAMLGSKK